MILIGMWRTCHYRERLGVMLKKEDSNADGIDNNPTPDTSIGDASRSEAIDFIAEAEILNMKKTDFSLTSE